MRPSTSASATRCSRPPATATNPAARRTIMHTLASVYQPHVNRAGGLG